jgi:MoaA/NifB/PqqE/SkfB family radical SAM enzyme
MFSLKQIFTKTNRAVVNGEIVKQLKRYNSHRPPGARRYLCHTPFKSMYFGHQGKVVACCYNRGHVLGVYPAMSIKEIWNGEGTNQLREYIKNNDLSLGCLGCRQQLMAGNFDAVKARQYDERSFNPNGYPSVMEFELSNLCNLECEMCSGDFSSLIRAKREKLPPMAIAYDAKFVDQLEEFIPYLEEVKFYGGEPFLIDIYYDIWERILKINPAVHISVQTNATVLNNRVKNILEHTNLHIGISLDSLNKTTYENIRKNAHFDRVMENVKYFHSYCKAKGTFIGISVCAIRSNWRELPDFIRYCNELEMPVYFHTVLGPDHLAIRSMRAAELAEITSYLQGFDFVNQTPVQKKNRTHYFDFLKQVITWHKDAETRRINNGISAGGKKLKSLSELQVTVTEYILQNAAMPENVKADKIEKIRINLTSLGTKVDPALLEAALAKYDFNDARLLDIVVYHFDHEPEQFKLPMLKSWLSR